jgi:glutamate carboxypeptidase
MAMVSKAFEPCLNWIETQDEAMRRMLVAWSAINSGSRHLDGLARMSKALREEFGRLGREIEEIELPQEPMIGADGEMKAQRLGRALRIRSGNDVRPRVFLGIHMDTVYASNHPFQTPTLLKGDILRGPGVADAKGGLIVMLFALLALDRSPYRDRIAWEVLINPDEELGSPGSIGLLREAARRNDCGLLFEPSLPDGALIGARKGSGNFTFVVRGKSAHVGREFSSGRSAIYALAEILLRLNRLNGRRESVVVNAGKIEGGGPVNVVPDLAIARVNARIADREDQEFIESEFRRLVEEWDGQAGIRVSLEGGFQSPPKPLDAATLRLLEEVAECGRRLGLDLNWRPSGGVCDGNKLAAAGLANVDTLGARGGNLHSSEEYVELPSLVERASLSALFLMRAASGEIEL